MKLPATVYVKIEKENNGSEFLTAAKDMFALAEDQVEVVGVYQLVGKKSVRKIVEVKAA